MKSLITKSLKLKAEAYQYQVMRFGNYRPHKPLTKAIASNGKAVGSHCSITLNCSPASTLTPC